MIEHVGGQVRAALGRLPEHELAQARDHLDTAAALAGSVASRALGAPLQDHIVQATRHVQSATHHVRGGSEQLHTYLLAIGAGASEHTAAPAADSKPSPWLDGHVIAGPDATAEAAHPTYEEIASLLLSEQRPTPQQLAQLIARGLTEKDIRMAARSAGQNLPTMNLTLSDLKVTLPFLETIADELARKRPDALLVFADRDSDLLYDFFTTLYPDRPAVLLPASSEVWRLSEGMRDPELARDFLAGYGLDEATVTDPSKKISVVDAGFNGSIALYLDSKLKELFGISLRDAGRMPIDLVATVKRTHGTQIADIADTDIPQLPKVFSWLEGDLSGFAGYSSAYRLAIALNLMPRSRDSYENIARQEDGTVRAVSRGPDYSELIARDRIHFQHTVDSNSDGFPDHNASIVSPVAAAIVQYRTMQAALALRLRRNG